MAGDDRADLLNEQWARVRGRLRAEVGEAAYRSWLKPLTMISAKKGVVRMAVPTRFMRDWVLSNYAQRIEALWREEDENVSGVEIIVQPPERPSLRPEAAPKKRAASAATPAISSRAPAASPPAAEGEPSYRDVSAPLDERLTFDNFVVGKPNELAYAAARRVAEARTVPFNPLFLYGPVG